MIRPTAVVVSQVIHVDVYLNLDAKQDLHIRHTV